MQKKLAGLQPLIRQIRLLIAPPATRRSLRLIFGVISVLAASYVLVTGVRRIDWAVLRLNGRYLIWAWLATVVTTATGVLGWAQLAKALFPSIPVTKLAHIHVRSLLAKYLPGGIWNSASKLVFLRQLGVSNKRASLALILEILMILLTGMEDALLLGNLFPSVIPAQARSPIFLFFALVVITTLCIALPFGVRRFADFADNDHVAKHNLLSPIKEFAAQLWLAELVYMVSWLCLCGCFSLVVNSVLPLNLNNLLTLVLATLLSFLISLIVIVIPNGIGLRELSYSVFMSKIMSISLAMSLGFIFRLVIAIAEITFVLTSLGLVSLHNARNTRKKRLLTPLDY